MGATATWIAAQKIADEPAMLRASRNRFETVVESGDSILRGNLQISQDLVRKTLVWDGGQPVSCLI